MTRARISETVSVGDDCPFLLIAGPCVIEGEAFTLRMAESIRKVCDALAVPLIFKASYDKANRSSIRSFRGVEMEQGLRILEKVRREVGVGVTTDVHESQHVSAVAEVVDLLQIPAFLCRQTDLLVACAETGTAINVKKGQFLAPWDMKNVLAKLTGAGAKDVLLTERGACFGYNALVVDFRSLPQMRELGAPVVFDATHSVQSPGGLGDRTGGQRQFVPHLARAAAAVGVDAIFMEVHEDPDNAPSDGPNMLKLGDLQQLVEQILRIREVVR
jgi:2-dehydro-3-deoxyphosphooctonate aldolase (KDO 8-P synthase)